MKTVRVAGEDKKTDTEVSWNAYIYLLGFICLGGE